MRCLMIAGIMAGLWAYPIKAQTEVPPDSTRPDTSTLLTRLQDSEERRAGLQKTLEEVSRQFQEAIEQKGREMTILQSEIDASRASLRELEQSTESLSARVRLLQLDSARFEHALDSLALWANTERGNLLADIEKVSGNNEQLATLLNAEQAKNQRLDSAYKNAERNSRDAEAQFARAVSSGDSLKAALTQQQVRERELQREYNAQTGKNKELETLIRRAEDSQKTMTAEVRKRERFIRIVGYLLSIMALVFVCVIAFVTSPIASKRKLLTADEKTEMLATTDYLHRDAVWQAAYYRRASSVFRHLLTASVAACGLLIVAIAMFLFIERGDPELLLSRDAFWKALAAAGFPLIFVTTAYNTIETRRLEMAKLLCDLRGQANPSRAHDPHRRNSLGKQTATPSHSKRTAPGVFARPWP